MAFKPAPQAPRVERDPAEGFNAPLPREGSRKARISLIVDCGTQNRKDFVKDGKTTPQKPAHQVAIFADLVADVVDYGGEIGEAQYRLPLNSVFKGEYELTNFYMVPPRDADGNFIKGRPDGFHPTSLLTKISNAVGKPEVVTSGDIEELLDQPFMAQVKIRRTPAKGDKKDKDGKPLVYVNVDYAGAAEVPRQEDDDGKDIGMLPVPKLRQKAMLISFDSATKEQIKFIRAGLLKQIKAALNYEGSQMEKAVKAFEAEKGGGSSEDEDDQPEQKPVDTKATAAKKKPVKQDPADDDVPF